MNQQYIEILNAKRTEREKARLLLNEIDGEICQLQRQCDHTNPDGSSAQKQNDYCTKCQICHHYVTFD